MDAGARRLPCPKSRACSAMRASAAGVSAEIPPGAAIFEPATGRTKQMPARAGLASTGVAWPLNHGVRHAAWGTFSPHPPGYLSKWRTLEWVSQPLSAGWLQSAANFRRSELCLGQAPPACRAAAPHHHDDVMILAGVNLITLHAPHRRRNRSSPRRHRQVPSATSSSPAYCSRRPAPAPRCSCCSEAQSAHLLVAVGGGHDHRAPW